MKKILFILLLLISGLQHKVVTAQIKAVPGAFNTSAYVEELKNKRVAVFANQTSMVEDQHLVDLLLKNAVNIKKIFGPEHGFRGVADAGEKVGNYTDEKTGIPVISLYGTKHKPSKEDLEDVDVVVFDIQDVGVRFYTFISSLQELMEAAFLNHKPMIILDRPNPNGNYVDGPVLNRAYKSFVGMQPVPVVYGMTIGEYAKMLVGEGWLDAASMQGFRDLTSIVKDPLKVVACTNYSRDDVYELPVKPSPNLPNMASIYWYPSICFFEGTVLSEGRGTPTPFQVFGHPALPKDLYRFTPISMPGATSPKLKDQVCYGWNVSNDGNNARKKINGTLHLEYLIEAYQLFPEKEKFFILPTSGDVNAAFFNKLVGSDLLMKQIQQGKSLKEIKASWEPALKAFKAIRKKYLLYK